MPGTGPGWRLLAAPLRAANSTAALIDRDAVWAAKRAALELIRAVPLTATRRAELDAFLARDRRTTEDWAMCCAVRSTRRSRARLAVLARGADRPDLGRGGPRSGRS